MSVRLHVLYEHVRWPESRAQSVGRAEAEELRSPCLLLVAHGEEPDPALRRGGRKMVNRRSQEAPETPGVGRELLQGDEKAGHRLG